MKSLFLLLFFLSAFVLQLSAKTHSPAPPQDGSGVLKLPKNAMDHPVVMGERAGDHPVVMGERAGDVGSGPVEHLAPIIFMVMAFLITVIVGIILWRNKTWVIPAILSSVFALVTFLLLANVNFYISDQHPDLNLTRHSHHWPEMVLSLIACALMFVLLFFFSSAVRYFLVFIAGAAELVVIVILLQIFPHHQFYKICNGDCLMRGSQAGVAFDLPCADNVAFMALHHTTGITPDDFRSTYVESGSLPLFVEYSSAIAMHDPLYPALSTTGGSVRSEDITFSLEERTLNPVATCSLYVYIRRHTQAEIEDPSFTFSYLPENASTLAGVWSRTGTVLTRTFPSTSTVDFIAHTDSYPSEANKVTFVSYKFKITYSNPSGVVPTAPEDAEVTFVLQDYYSIYPHRPVPVYSQGDLHDVMDVLFIPAQNDADMDPLEEAFFTDFRASCRDIIKDAVFQEPAIRYWRKHFNFWINPDPGRASDGSCGDCCHVQPENIDLIPAGIEFRALLHEDVQLDFTDHCNTLFSAEMHLANDNGEKSSFLHELGHAAFGLCDEYPGGFNYQAVEHLPNNWESRHAAKDAAPMRHKQPSDVVKLH